MKGISYNDSSKGDINILFSTESELFEYTEKADLNGKVKWKSYKEKIPSFKVIELSDGKCVVGREEVFTRDNLVVEEITSQKINPCLDKELNLDVDEYIDARVACLYIGELENNYYHFNVEFLMRYWLFVMSEIQADYYLCHSEESFSKKFYEILSIDEKILFFDKGKVLQCSSLIVPSLINNYEFHRAINLKPLYWKRWLPSFGKQVYAYIKNKINNLEELYQGERIYISRNHSSKRIIKNEDKLLDVIIPKGFEVKYLEELDVVEQIACFAGAKIIIAPHGAGLVNLSYCNAGTTVLELYPRNYHDPGFRLHASLMELDYNYLICKGTGLLKISEEPAAQDIIITNRELMRINDFLHKMDNKLS